MAFSITSVSPTEILSDGGHKIEVTGLYEAGHRYQVNMGDLGSNADPVCYSGIPGQAEVVFPRKSTSGGALDLLTVYSPRVNPSPAPYSIYVLDLDTLEAHVLSSVVTTTKHQFFTNVYAVRSVQPPKYKVGPRSINLEQPT